MATPRMLFEEKVRRCEGSSPIPPHSHSIRPKVCLELQDDRYVEAVALKPENLSVSFCLYLCTLQQITISQLQFPDL